MAVYCYKITRDYGFAPNPFYSFCTLATCKPHIRKKAKVGDWVIGFGSSRKGSEFAGRIIYIMKVTQKMTFDEYWNAPEFQCKKPVMNGSRKQIYGDNIYHKVNGKWKQEDSHHSKYGGEENKLNLDRDTSADSVLISSRFWYYGKLAIKAPKELKSIIPDCRNYICNDKDELIEKFVSTFEENGFIGEPIKLWEDKPSRYDGK